MSEGQPIKGLPPGKYPWVEHVTCRGESGRGCGATYKADYRQDRDWSFCPQCTGEVGKRCLRIFDPEQWRYLTWNSEKEEYE